jgi:hexosaminidase
LYEDWTVELDFLEQAFLTTVNEVPEAQLQINIVRNGEIKLNEDESYKLTG